MIFKIQYYKINLEYKAILALLDFEQIPYIELGEQISTLKYLRGKPGVAVLNYDTNELVVDGFYNLVDFIKEKGLRQI